MNVKDSLAHKMSAYLSLDEGSAILTIMIKKLNIYSNNVQKHVCIYVLH